MTTSADHFPLRIEATPEAVEKWKQSQKHGVQWVDLKAEVPEGGEPPRLKSRTEMETHFRTHHAPTLLGEAARVTAPGNIPKHHLSPPLYHALRRTVDDARKHLLATAQLLCVGFEKHGLKLFKRRGGKLWVSRIRPRLLDSTISLSDRITKLMEIIKTKPGISVKNLIETAVPGDATEIAPAVESETPAQPAADANQTETAPAVESQPAEAKPSPLALERMHALNDLHWLNSEGYVTEYSDGVVFIGVTEPPPAKPKAVKEAPAEKAADPAPTEEATTPDAAIEEIAEAPEAPVHNEQEAPAVDPPADK